MKEPSRKFTDFSLSFTIQEPSGESGRAVVAEICVAKAHAMRGPVDKDWQCPPPLVARTDFRTRRASVRAFWALW